MLIDVAISLTALSQLQSLVAPVFLLYIRLLSGWGRKYSNACLGWSVHGPPHHFCPRFSAKVPIRKIAYARWCFYPVRDQINPRRVLAYSFTFFTVPYTTEIPDTHIPHSLCNTKYTHIYYVAGLSCVCRQSYASMFPSLFFFRIALPLSICGSWAKEISPLRQTCPPMPPATSCAYRPHTWAMSSSQK